MGARRQATPLHPTGDNGRGSFVLGARLGNDGVANRPEGQKGRTAKGAQCLEWLVGLNEEERALSRDTSPAAASLSARRGVHFGHVAHWRRTIYVGVTLTRPKPISSFSRSAVLLSMLSTSNSM